MATRKKRRGPKRRTRRKTATHHISPMAHLARKVSGLDTRVNRLESTTVKRKGKRRHTGTLEGGHGRGYWATGE